VLGGTISGGLQRNGAEVASCCNTPIHRWGALAIRPGGPAADTMAFMHRVSGWLGRLSVGRKLMLIYLLDLTALVAGTQFRGQFESRMKGLIELARRAACCNASTAN
jgi:hypothetical protein